jgi:nucleoside-diphosphate-sugar epimerase
MLGWPLREEFDAATPDRPDSVYAATKIFGENVGRVYAYQPHFRGRKPDGVSLSSMQVICLRLGQPFISYQEWSEGQFRGSRVAVHTEDIAYAIECALFTDVKYGVYTIVSEVENPRIDPGMYEEIGYSPQWKFTEEGLVNVSRAAVRL